MALSCIRLADSLSCHALSPDGSTLAVCPNNETVALYNNSSATAACTTTSPNNPAWQQSVILTGHEQVVSALDWSPDGQRLVSASYDRNSYVWTRQQNDDKLLFKPELVITRLTRAGLCVKWSHNSRKFAIGSGEPSICVCSSDAQRQLWAPKLIRQCHTSTIMGLAWHPSDAVLATVSTDGTCRLTNVYIPFVDNNSSSNGSQLPSALTGTKFGDTLLEIPTNGGWGLGVAWSPSGNELVLVSQQGVVVISGFDINSESGIAFELDDGNGGGKLKRQDVEIPSLPLKCVTFLTEDVIVGGGFDYKPLVITRDVNGGQQWKVDGFVRGDTCSGVSGLHGEAASKTSGNSDDQQDGLLKNCIVSISSSSSVDGVLKFLTASQDGKITEWKIEN